MSWYCNGQETARFLQQNWQGQDAIIWSDTLRAVDLEERHRSVCYSPRSIMVRRNSSSAYRDMDEEFFSSLEEANYQCHESPAKSSCFSSKLSESKILHQRWEKRRAVRGKVVVTLSLLLLAGVGTAALYTSMDTTVLAMKMRGAYPIFRGSASVLKESEIYTGEDVPDFGDAILASDETVTQRKTNYALDNAMLEELDPYEEFRRDGRQLEAN
ncbi:hypothetical protein L917_06653 [Phytophthora nicotianae]|uniref:Uncharacterized protein n=2 Tax=Phytophthora nicotianae TaxID=4792 RepID=W2LFU6_PHYNI|nr:hypothetical protein L917_06653 [Phytophthora nicotianae]